MKGKRPHKSIDKARARPSPEPYQRNPVEAAFVADHLKRKRERLSAPKLKLLRKDGPTVQVEPDHPDHTLWDALLHAGMGSLDWRFTCHLLDQLTNASSQASAAKPYDVNEANAILAAMHGIAPKDEAEAMLAAQMVATHTAAMSILRRLKSCETTPQQDSAGNLANKLLRTYAAQLEALARYRGKGQQTVRVEHVTVQAGGQAIVGAVSSSTTPGGRGTE